MRMSLTASAQMTSTTKWVREGCIIGSLAFGLVAGFYLAFDLLAARGALYTVNQLGTALLRGPAELGAAGGAWPVYPAAILAYSALHLTGSLLIGILVARLVREAELRPMQAQIALLFIVAGFAGTIALAGTLSEPIRDVLPWWSIIAANALAVAGAGYVMIRRHPGFLEEMTENPRFPAA